MTPKNADEAIKMISQSKSTGDAFEKMIFILDKAMGEGYLAALNGPEVKELLDYIETWSKFSNGEPVAKKLLSDFRSKLGDQK